MKIRHLPITDLARIAILDRDSQLHALRQVKSSGQGPNYNPTRKSFADIVDRQPAMFESVRTPWLVVRAQMLSACRSEDEQKMNLPVTDQLYRYCDENNVRATEVEGYPISFSMGPKLLCWSPGLFIYPDRLAIPFLDLRRTRNLNSEAMRFLFSIMHQALRVNNPDYSDVEFEIFKFKNNAERTIKTYRESSFVWQYSYEQLEIMINFTQNLWIFILSERYEQNKNKGSASGSLL